jgi:ribulose-5-phosphate 4-epimerase/fuculose-1-phosphate aldolase
MSIHALAERQNPVQEARVDLAAAFRLAARLNFDDTIWNHFSLTVPGTTDRFLVKPHGLLMKEIRASDLIIVDTDGNTVEGRGACERSGACIHIGVHMRHPRAACVLHSHMRHATWLSMVEGGRLLPINQNGLRFYNRVSYDDHYNGLAIVTDEGKRIADCLGDNNILVLANHGVIAVGTSVAEAFYDLYYFEVSCEEQYMLACSGAKPNLIRQDIAQLTLDQYVEGEAGAPFEYFDAMKRMLTREEPEFRE